MGESTRFSETYKVIEVVAPAGTGLASLSIELGEILTLQKTHNVNRVLIDVSNVEAISSLIEIYNFMSNLPRELSYAICASEDQQVFSDLEFAENVSVNRGIRVKIFTGRKDALTWLQQF